jgi:predicted metal-dependent enzyme (double-stranded beta helix superfamily)
MDILDQLLADARDAMGADQTAVTDVLQTALDDHERLAAAIRSRPKPWCFSADDTMTVFCTEGRPGNASPPHDHGTWSVLGCFDGSEESWWHQADSDGLRHIGSGVLRAGDTHSLPADAIHSVMNRWDTPNGIVHIYNGNFLAADRHIWDPVTSSRHPAGLAEPLAPAHQTRPATPSDDTDIKPALAGTAFAAVTVNSLGAAGQWMTDAFGLRTLTTHDDSCAVDQRYNYLIEPVSLTIIGIHQASEPQTRAGLDHVALRVPTIAQLERWHESLASRGHQPWDCPEFG